MIWAVARHPLVEDDLDACAAYIYADNPDAAFRFIDAVEATFDALAETPLLGTPAGFAGDLSDLRRRLVLRFESYLLFYRANQEAERVEVLALVQGARDLPEHLSERVRSGAR